MSASTPKDPRQIKPSDIVAKVMTHAENGNDRPFLLGAISFNKDIGYGLFREDDVAEIFARHASDYQRQILPMLGTDVEATITHFHDTKRASEIVEKLVKDFPRQAPIKAFAEIVGDARITQLFSADKRKSFVSAQKYDKRKNPVKPRVIVPDLTKPQNQRKFDLKIIPRAQSYEDFIEQRRLKASDVINMVNFCIKEGVRVTTNEEFLERLLKETARKKHYTGLPADAVGAVVRAEMRPQQWTGILDRISAFIAKRQGGLIVPPSKIQTKDLENKLSILQIFQEATAGLSPKGRSVHGKPVPAARIKKSEIDPS